jgi:hypothetical protein
MPTVPPGRVTLNISSAVRLGRGAIIAPNTEPTQSKRPSSKGSSSASASSHSIAYPSDSLRARPRSTMPGDRSEATTVAPSRAAARAKLPSPAATSSTSWPADTAAASDTACAAGRSRRDRGE